MSLALRIHDEAEVDIREQMEFFEEAGAPDVGDRFLLAIEDAMGFLLEHPDSGSLRIFSNPGLYGMRMWPVRGFQKHLIFYRASDDLLEIVRVLHSSRDIASIFDG